jgi:hypothetical protein
MRPAATTNAGSIQPHYSHSHAAVPEERAPSPSHSLRDVKLEPPYTEKDIAQFLKLHQVCKTGESTFDDCLFQSVLFTEFFDKIEKSEANPGQWEEHDRPALYLLKKSVELLQPLSVKIEETSHRYDELLRSLPPEPAWKLKELNKQLPYVKGMVAKFQKLEMNLLNAVADPESFRPTRDKACFLLFVHTMLSDTADEMQSLMDALVSGGQHVSWRMPVDDEVFMIKSYLTTEETPGNLFSSGPLTPSDASIYKGCMKNYETEFEGLEKAAVPSFSQTGTQGVLAILHCIFEGGGKGLLTAAVRRPHSVHDRAYLDRRFSLMRHDWDHLEAMLEEEASTSSITKLMPIYLNLKNAPRSMEVKRDFLVLFHLLHEDQSLIGALGSMRPRMSFLDRARAFFRREFEVVDMVALLNKVGFSIAPIDKKSSDKEKTACYEAVALAMDSLWKEFRARHHDVLGNSGWFAKLPKFLAD